LKTGKTTKDKVNVITLGCSKNLVDSEVFMGHLRANKVDVEHQSEKNDSNIVVINTCGFIDLAKEESIDTIIQYSEEKKQGNIEKLYVTGCLSQRYKDDLEKEIPEVDAFFGTMDLPLLLNKFNISLLIFTTPNSLNVSRNFLSDLFHLVKT
jgi:ribosomal protein S12 methylthiotransferase